MSTFVAVPFDGWPLIAEALTASGQPWPEAAAVADLRWWTAEAARELGLLGLERDDLTDDHRRAIRAALPGRPALVARWGWTDWAVKGLRATPERWWQADRWGVQPNSASAPPARRQPTASAPPVQERRDAENRDDSASPPPALRQPAASETPSRVPSFTDGTDLREHSNTTRAVSDAPSAAPGPSAVVTDPEAAAREQSAAELLALQHRDEPAHGLGHNDLGALRRALGRGVSASALAALWEWSGVSEDPLVAGCRAGWRRWASLLKAPTGEARIAAAVAWVAAGRPADRPPRARPGPRPSGFAAPRGTFDRGALPAEPVEAHDRAELEELYADIHGPTWREARPDLVEQLDRLCAPAAAAK